LTSSLEINIIQIKGQSLSEGMRSINLRSRIFKRGIALGKVKAV